MKIAWYTGVQGIKSYKDYNYEVLCNWSKLSSTLFACQLKKKKKGKS